MNKLKIFYIFAIVSILALVACQNGDLAGKATEGSDDECEYEGGSSGSGDGCDPACASCGEECRQYEGDNCWYCYPKTNSYSSSTCGGNCLDCIMACQQSSSGCYHCQATGKHLCSDGTCVSHPRECPECDDDSDCVLASQTGMGAKNCWDCVGGSCEGDSTSGWCTSTGPGMTDEDCFNSGEGISCTSNPDCTWEDCSDYV